MKVFVTGGSGFVGRAWLRHLARAGIEAVAIVRSERSAAVVEALGARPVQASLGDVAALAAAMAGCEGGFHLAAANTEALSRAALYEVNVEGTARVLAAARAAGVRRVVHVSSESVLAGRQPIVRADETWPLPPDPIGGYPWSKALAEQRALEANGEGLEVVVVRPRWIWGPDDTKVLPELVAAVRAGAFAWIDGGRYLTSTCHIRNLVEGLALAYRRGRPGEVYFLTDGEPVEFRTFVTRLLATQGVDAGERSLPRQLAWALATAGAWAWRCLPLPGAPPLMPGRLRLVGEEVTVVDAKARRELGYTGATSIEAGLRELMA